MKTATAVEPSRNDGYVLDIRVFLASLTVAMAISFLAGVGLGPFGMSNWSPNDVVRNDLSHAGGEENHLPAGQHLLVDMKGVDTDFLNSEERLSKAMVDTVLEAGLTLLSYHCHALVASGVSCVGVLLESHISFHTWPSDKVITLDLFTCGPKPLLPAIKTIQRLFGIGEDVRTKWSHELRGFRPQEERKKNYLDDSSDLSYWVLSPLELYSKEEIYSNVTKLQRVDIWDIREESDTPGYEDILKYNMSVDDPRLRSPEYATPDRLLFLDGILQSISSSEVVYHEAMVQPAMFAHPKPEHVVIVGGGEGGTLREVLKHKSLKSVEMIEMDAELVQIARQFLPNMSNCSDLVGRADNCFDDELATIYYEEARQWFHKNYGPGSSKDPIDVLLVDALDPEEDSPASELLYTDIEFIDRMVGSLSEDGVLVIQIGTAATIDDPRPDFGIYKNREKLFNLLEENELVAAMMVYEEAHAGFLEPHAFIVACRDVKCRSRWYARNDAVDFEVYDRIVLTKSRARALKYYDGTTQHSYQWPKKGWETVYCRREPTPFECAYRTISFDAEIHELDLEDQDNDSYDLRISHDSEGEELTSVFATRKIKEGSFIMPSHLASSLEVTNRNLEGLKRNVEVGGGRVAVIEDLLAFFDDYAHETQNDGLEVHYVEVGGSALIRRVDSGDTNVKRWVPNHPSGKRPKYSPVYDRHRVSFDVFLVASRDILPGEELLMLKDVWKTSD